jgi:hypothetical protein
LGRTGLTIACYLVYAENLTADAVRYKILTKAISLVRGKRPLSVQTKKQTQFVHFFENHLKKIKISYYGVVESSFKVIMNTSGVTFEEALINQRQWINPSESQKLRYIPKVCLVLTLLGCQCNCFKSD